MFDQAISYFMPNMLVCCPLHAFPSFPVLFGFFFFFFIFFHLRVRMILTRVHGITMSHASRRLNGTSMHADCLSRDLYIDDVITFTRTWLQPPGYVHAMITSSWQPNVVNSTVTAHAAAPVWSTHVNKSLTCAGSEYQGDLGVMATADTCLAAVQKHDVQSPGTINFALYKPRRVNSPKMGCYVCLIPGDPSTWKLTDTKGATSFEGTNIEVPFSVSSQQSDDKKTLVVRIVNHGAAQTANIKLQGFVAASATAVSMASDDPNAENSAATPTHVSPRPLSTFTIKGTSGTITVPTHSFTVVTLLSEAKGR